jgi:cysteine-rich repeat protein
LARSGSLAVAVAVALVSATALVSPAAWCTTEDHELLASDGAASDYFGRSVSIDGGVALVGANLDDDGGADAGAAYVYRWNGASWAEEHKLLAGDGEAGDSLGLSVSLDGDVALVGAPGEDARGAGAGAGYVYRWDGVTWSQEQKLLASDGKAGDSLGRAVSIDGDVAVVGAYGDDENGSAAGAAYVYRFDGGSWIQEQKLLASDGEAGDSLGRTVSIDGGVALVGAYSEDENGSAAGAAYVYRFDGASWTQEQKLLASDGAAGDQFGISVSTRDDVALVGAYFAGALGAESGAAYAYRWDGASWTQEQKLLASNGAAGDRFGVSVATGDGVALVGAYFDDDNGANAGAAYAYRWDGAAWGAEQPLLASGGAAGDHFGISVSIDRDLALVGASLANVSGVDSGAAYVFDLGACGDGTLDPGEACDDGASVPGDGCSAVCQLEACTDALDDDMDGLTDFSGGDPGCWGAADLSERSGFLPCDNGLDDDGDGLTDYPDDPDCIAPTHPWESTDCNDGLDNDGDGALDYPDDPGCADPSDLKETDPALPCDNGLDDDGDGLSDLAGGDPGCASLLDAAETDPALPCDNGLDDDGDGLVDLAGGDPGCASLLDAAETDPALPCDNGLDDDLDGRTDFDPATFLDPLAGAGDLGCHDPAWPHEDPKCQDGLDNDADLLIDWDGGASAGVPPAQQTAPDPFCAGSPWRDRETQKIGCGIGFELAPTLALLLTLRRRRSPRSLRR